MLARGFCGIEVAVTCGRVGSGLVPEVWGKLSWEKVWPFLDARDSVRLRTVSAQWNIPGKYGLYGELLFSLMQKKRALVPDSEAFYSVIGDGFRVPELKDGSEASNGDQADNVSTVALHVIGLHGPGDKISLCLQDWGDGQGGTKLSHGSGHAVPGNVRTGKETWLFRVLKEPVG